MRSRMPDWIKRNPDDLWQFAEKYYRVEMKEEKESERARSRIFHARG